MSSAALTLVTVWKLALVWVKLFGDAIGEGVFVVVVFVIGIVGVAVDGAEFVAAAATVAVGVAGVEGSSMMVCGDGDDVGGGVDELDSGTAAGGNNDRMGKRLGLVSGGVS